MSKKQKPMAMSNLSFNEKTIYGLQRNQEEKDSKEYWRLVDEGKITPLTGKEFWASMTKLASTPLDNK